MFCKGNHFHTQKCKKRAKKDSFFHFFILPLKKDAFLLIKKGPNILKIQILVVPLPAKKAKR